MITVMSRRLYSPIDEIDRIIRKNLNAPYAGGELLDNLRELIKNNVDMNKQILVSQENSKQLFLRRVYLGEAQCLLCGFDPLYERISAKERPAFVPVYSGQYYAGVDGSQGMLRAGVYPRNHVFNLHRSQQHRGKCGHPDPDYGESDV